MIAMVYLLKPVNCPYDPEEPMPTPLGFIAPTLFYKGANELKREFKPVPANLVHRRMEIGGDRLMPDFFSTQSAYFFVSSRFRSLLERYAPGQVEYIELDLAIPTHKEPADAYYFINVLGRRQMMNWELTLKRKRRVYFWDGPPEAWVMNSPSPGHVAIWHETDRIEHGEKFCGDGTAVFVTDQLGNALDAAFPRQCRLRHIREVQAAQ